MIVQILLGGGLPPWSPMDDRVRGTAAIAPMSTPMGERRQCGKRTLATNCVPGYGWQATMALQDRLFKPEVRHYCYQRPLLCSTPAIVFNAP